MERVEWVGKGVMGWDGWDGRDERDVKGGMKGRDGMRREGWDWKGEMR